MPGIDASVPRPQRPGLFEGLDLVEPGVVPAGEWRPAPGDTIPERSDITVWTAVGRIP